MSRVTSRFSQAELLLGIAALILLAIEVLLWILLRAYGISELQILLSVGILVVLWQKSSGRTPIIEDPRALLLMGASLAVISVFFALGDLRGLTVSTAGIDGVEWLGLLAEWIATALAVAGTYLLLRPGARLGA